MFTSYTWSKNAPLLIFRGSRLGHDVIKILFIVERSTSYISLEGEFYADQLFCSTHVLKVNFHQAK